MTSQEIIDKLTELDVPTSVAQDQNNDPYTLLEKINYVLSKLDELIAREGTQVKVAGIVQKLIDFVDDPQDQITNLTDAVALNVEGIAHMNEIKQDKLSQTDLDNIAMLNQLQDKLDAKASKTEVNSLSMCPSDTYDTNVLPNILTSSNENDNIFVPKSNGYLFFNCTINGSTDFMLYLGNALFTTFKIFSNEKKELIIPLSKGKTYKFRLYGIESLTSKKSETKFVHTKEI